MARSDSSDSSHSSHSSPSTPSPIPAPYRTFFLFLEPVSALAGAYYAHFCPLTYLELTHRPSAPDPAHLPPATAIVLTQLANLYLLFAINEAVVLRSTNDLGVWKALLLGLLIADFGHLYSVSSLGPSVYYDYMRWNAIDWGNVGFVYLGATMRLAFLSGIGLPH
ncbi:hypothetical protein K490DRAFT_31146 [Saccharata proteae CBS 121410]|uniref:DUF7704 domain-containing protein n=1 Tax=Saccharata proteae CBS 121410 TaxID=1314787 RepID=A0A9P4I3H1_9PEZI|nr:hypothetical protein K490DRAFT_31146 [Saccharata proteae CBS 121410]